VMGDDVVYCHYLPLFHLQRIVEIIPSIMILRTTWLFFLAANAAAFVISPASLGRCSVAVSPICSSLMSDPDTDTNQGGVENSLENGNVEAAKTDDDTEATSSSDDDSSAPIRKGPPARHTVYIGNLPFSKPNSQLETSLEFASMTSR
jgi:hypothetical protein